MRILMVVIVIYVDFLSEGSYGGSIYNRAKRGLTKHRGSASASNRPITGVCLQHAAT
jgi:hypothetical protein